MNRLVAIRPGVFVGLCLSSVLAGLLALWQLGVTSLGIDDAYIYFVYAKNFIASGEFVYNLGDERVEGFSSPLWLAVCILASLVAATPTLPLLLVATLLTAWITAQCLAYIETLVAEQANKDAAGPISPAGWLFLACVFANPSWFAWNVTSLMETPLWGALIVGTMITLIRILRAGELTGRARLNFILLIVALAVARPEAPLWVAWFVLGYLVTLAANGLRGRRLITETALAAGAGALSTAALLGARLSYFGYPFANTYYAKMSPDWLYNLSEGLKYFSDFTVKNGVAGLGILIAIWALYQVARSLLARRAEFFSADNRENLESFLLAGTAGAGVVAALITGGDKFGGFRFYQSFLPVLYLLALRAGVLHWPQFRLLVSRPLPLAKSLALTALTGLLMTMLVSSSWQRLHRTNLAIEYRIAEQLIDATAVFEEIFAAAETELPTLAFIPAGGSKFGTQARVLDMMGLNLTAMAHSEVVRTGVKNHAAFDENVFWELNPDMLGVRRCHWDSRPWTDDRFEWRVLKGLTSSERFLNSYSYVHFTSSDSTRWNCAFIRNDYLEAMRANPAFTLHRYDQHTAENH